MTIIYAILMLCMLIFIHEFGHFIAAKACGVKVNEFALGMGPVLVQKQKGDTMYSLRAIPIGGFCAMEGEDEESTHDDAFCNKKPWQKVIPVSESMIKNAVNDVKKSFYEYGGMSGDKKSEYDAYSAKLNAYYKTLDVEDRLAASWTLDQIRLELAEHVKKEVQAQNPKWKVGQPIDSKVLDKIFAEEKVTSKYKHSVVTGTYKGINKRA